MADNKKYYWLKLKENFFEEDTINWIEEQENGKEYCLFYLKLCLKSLKTDGVLIRKVGDLLIPYDVKKLSDMTKTELDTVRVAMELFKQIGLIEILENGEIYLSQLKNMVGCETAKAESMRKLREKRRIGNNVTEVLPNCYTEIEIEKEKEIKENIKRKKFVKPTLDEIRQYCIERNNLVNPETFFDFYESNGWKVGKNSMKDWKASVRTWEKSDRNKKENKFYYDVEVL